MYRAPLRRLVPAITIIACLLAAPSAMAASATVDAGQDRLEYTASTGERNLLTVTGSSNTYTIEDAVSNISAGTGCTQLAAKRVRCSSVPSGPIKSIYLELRDQDDSVVNSAAIAVEVIAGEGADTLTGGTLTGDKLYGGLGDDLLDGGLGADFLSGDEGRDRVTYAMRTAPLNVNLATFWGGDGEVGEYDFIYTVEEVVGGSGDDRMTGSSGPNSFIGGPGNDILEGQDGNDALEGGAGADRLEGGNGDDALRSRDAVADTVNCGAGMDSMDVDAVDTVAADCERPATGPAAVPATLDRVPKSVRLTRKGYLRIKVTCPVAAVNGCKGTVTIAVLARSAGVTLSAATAAAGNKFSLKAGESKVTKVKISRNGRRRILRKKRANCKVSVHTRRGSSRVTVSKKITVKAPRKERKSR